MTLAQRARENERERKRKNVHEQHREHEKERQRDRKKRRRDAEAASKQDARTYHLGAKTVKKYAVDNLTFKHVNISAADDFWHARPGWTGRFPPIINVNDFDAEASKTGVFPAVADVVWEQNVLKSDCDFGYYGWDGV
jgi:hypothetical protein